MTVLFRRFTRWLKGKRPTRAGLLHFWCEHGVALLFFALLSIGLSWPTAQHFTTRMVSDGGDARTLLWTIWHTRQWVLGQQPLFSAPLLYYPYGTTLLLHGGAGLSMGLFALPFWGLGPEAAYNGAALIGLWLTGYCMYLLARGLQFERGVALFAGTVLMVAPIHLVGLYGHLDKVFLGLIPLALLFWHHALDPKRSAGWTVATALVLLLTALHSAYQFVYSGLAIAFFLLAAWLAGDRAARRVILRRVGLFVLSSLVLLGPLLAATLIASRDPAFQAEANLESLGYSPELLQYVLPASRSLLLGSLTQRAMVPYIKNHPLSLETVVSVLWTGLLLAFVAWVRGPRLARRWLLFTLLGTLLSLGPTLRFLGRTEFTEYRLPVILPYAFLTALPGLDFMRTPGRFMMPTYVGLAISAGFGLAWLLQRFPKGRRAILWIAPVLVLLEGWPKPWPQEILPPVPSFYRQIARDGELYGVFDLPLKPTAGGAQDGSFLAASSSYQVYQMVHGKGIFGGYVSRRTSFQHPFLAHLEGCDAGVPDISWNGEPVRTCKMIKAELARHGYRYVVWHKTLFAGTPGQDTARRFIEAMFGNQLPLVDDALVRVYRLPTLTEVAGLTNTVLLRDHWYPTDDLSRWAISPATLVIESVREQPALLRIMPVSMHDPDSPNGRGRKGVLLAQVGKERPVPVEVTAGRLATVPLLLPEGRLTVTLSLQAGNFRPADYGGTDQREFSFALRSLGLETLEGEIRPTGFYRNKAKHIKASCTMIVQEFDGKVPDNMEDLLKLPGVARKTANIVLSNAYGRVEGIAVDTHVRRVSQRLGLTGNKDPDKIEKDLIRVFPKEAWFPINYLLIELGREICVAGIPYCEKCPLNRICPSAFTFGKRKQKSRD